MQLLNTVRIGGEPVAYDRIAHTLRLAGDEYTLQEWLEFRRRVDLIVSREMTEEEWKEYREERNFIDKRSRLPQAMREPPPPWEGRSSSFLSANVSAINRFRRGLLIEAPWWLRWLFDGVVTKQELHD